MNQLELAQVTRNSQTVINFLRARNLLCETINCCNKRCFLVDDKGSDGQIFRCQVCFNKMSIRRKSFFEHSKLPLIVLVYVIYYFAVGTGLTECLKHLHGLIGKKVLVQWYTYLHEVCSLYLIHNDNLKLGGVGKTVQIDESFIRGKRKYMKGNIKKRAKQQILFGMVKVETGKCLVRVVPDRKKRALLPIIQEFIVPGSVIHSDEAHSYFCLTQHGFVHRTVKHKETYKSLDGTHTNNIENLWSQVKYVNKKTKGTCAKHFAMHIDEFLYRKNRRINAGLKANDNIFDLILADIAHFYRVN